MRRLFIVTMLLLFSFSVTGQSIFDKEEKKEETIFSSSLGTNFSGEKDVYSTTNGIKNVTPDYTIEKKEDENNVYNIYNVENGIKEVTPSFSVEKSDSGTKVYKVKNGIKEVTPSFYID